MDSNLAPRSDAQLLAGCLNGDSSCQEAFVHRFSNLVFATIQRVLKIKNIHLSQQSIEDLHQTVFLLLFEKRCCKLRQFQGKNGCRLASWVRMLTSRIVLDHLRRGTDALAPRHQTVSLESASGLNVLNPCPIECLTVVEQLDQIQAALNRLKVRDQLVIRMHYLEGRPLLKIAKALGISSKNIHSVKHRAIQRLKAKIKICEQ